MSAEKLSISMEASLVREIRSAAAEEGLNVSTWLAEAASARARQRALREALNAHARRYGGLAPEAATRLVERARQRSRVSRPGKRRA